MMGRPNRDANEWPPRHTRPKLRARAYRLNLMAAKQVSIAQGSYYTHQEPCRRCTWCHRPVYWEYLQWPKLCACCGWLLLKWEDAFTFNAHWLNDGEIPF